MTAPGKSTVDFVEGVHFGMPAEDYHAIPALSNSMIKWLLISPLDFWARCSWLNPDAEQDEDTVAKSNGTAFHDRIVEGREIFYQRNAPALDPDDFPEALRTADDLKDACRARGLKVGGSKADLIAKLTEADPTAQIWDAALEEHAARHEGKKLLYPTFIRRIEIAAAMIERHPDLCKAFTGGQPEVVICWTDEEYQIPMKARLDYLKVRAIVDLKSIGNPLGKSLDKAMAGALASYKYHQQAALYQDAADQIAALLRAGQVYGEHDPEWLAKVAATAPEQRKFLFVFQFTGPAPVARGKLFPRGLVYDCGTLAIREGLRRYRECLDTFGTDPWIDTTPITPFDDSEIPSWAVE